jgi:hypothetical protein
LSRSLGANIVVRQKIIKSINAPSARADLSHISSLLAILLTTTHSTRPSSSAAKRRRDTSGPKKDRGANAASGSYNGSALEEIAFVGLDGEADGVSNFLLVAADEGVGGCGGQGGEGRDGDGGETHDDGFGGNFGGTGSGSEGVAVRRYWSVMVAIIMSL